MSAQSDRFRVLRRLTEIRFEDELRGYSKNQVDRVLETLVPLADDVEQLQAKLAEAERRVATAEAGLVEAREQAARTVEIEPVAAPIEVEVAESATPSADFDETLRNTLMLAQRTADTVVREASEEAEELRTSARAEALELAAQSQAQANQAIADGESARSEMLTSVEAERVDLLKSSRAKASKQIAAIEAELSTVHESQRSELISQIEDLQGIRDLLADDIDNFEAYLAERRETVRLAMSEINVVLDDPARIRPSMPPVAAKVEEINPDAYKPIKVELESLQEAEEPLGSENDGDEGEDADLISSLLADDSPKSSIEATSPSAGSTNIDDLLSAGPATEAVPIVLDAAEVAEAEVVVAEVAQADVGTVLSDPWEDKPSQSSTEKHVAPGAASAAKESGVDASEAESNDSADTAIPDAESPKSSAAKSAGSDAAAKPVAHVESGIPDRLTASPGESAPSAAPRVVEEPAAADSAENPTKSESSSGGSSASVPDRPAWADSVPNESTVQDSDDKVDPFLDELRKANAPVTSDGSPSSSSDDDKDSSRGGWFGRRR